MEKEAHHFASAFLLPNSSFAKEVISTSHNHFLILKKRWKVSISAMLFRCSDLGLLSDDQVLNIRKQLSFKKWTKKEPLDDVMKVEKPYLMRQSFELITDNEKSTNQSALKIIEFFSWKKSDIEDKIDPIKWTLQRLKTPNCGHPKGMNPSMWTPKRYN